MNKREAKEMAYRLVSCLIEEYMQSGEPDTYDPMFSASGVEGRRLSNADQDRFSDALIDLQDKLGLIGDRVFESLKARDGKRDWPQPSGKPGSGWKGHEARLKRWGWTW